MKKLLLLLMIMGVSLGMLYSQTITVTSPNGGEGWQIGSSHNITWTSSGVTGNVTLKLYRGGTDLGRIDANPVSNTGNYSWNIPVSLPNGTAIPPAGNYRVMVRSTATVNDLSNGNFTITANNPKIHVHQPYANVTLAPGQYVNIKWGKSGSMNNLVKIGLHQGSTEILTIKNQTQNDGTYGWNIPANIAKGTYRVKVITIDNLVSDFSSKFQISKYQLKSTSPPVARKITIQVLEPKGGEKWKSGNFYDIRWYSKLKSKFTIYLYCGGKKIKIGEQTTMFPSGRYMLKLFFPAGLPTGDCTLSVVREKPYPVFGHSKKFYIVE